MEGNLESALRRAACWAPRGMATGAQLLAGTEGRLRFRPSARTSTRGCPAARKSTSA